MVIKLTKNGNISNNVKDRKPLSHSVLQGLLDDILQISIEKALILTMFFFKYFYILAFKTTLLMIFSK